MKPMNCVLILLTAYAVNVKQISSFKVDTMDTVGDEITLLDTSSPFYSSGILKSHSGLSYTADRNKTVKLLAPQGYSIFAAVRLFDLRPLKQDYLTLFANGTAGPKKYWNIYSDHRREFDVYENKKTFYAPDGKLGVTFFTGPSLTWGYDGFELIYTVQANWTKCVTDNFWCSNGRCISNYFKCDGHNHCGDRSDQKDCFFPDPVTPTSGKIVGVTGGAIFLLVAVACAVYIIIKRARRANIATRTVINHHSPPTAPTNIEGYPPPYSEPGMVYPPPPPYSPYKQGIVNPGYQ